jgi:hypothetical protein
VNKVIWRATLLACIALAGNVLSVSPANAALVGQTDGSVLDTTTGLAWLQDWGPLSTGSWDQQQAKIADLNTSNYLGHNDWYMPSLWDFYALWDGVGASNVGLRSVFSNTPQSYYWTSIEDPNYRANHYAFDVYGGGPSGGFYGYNLGATAVRTIAINSTDINPVPIPGSALLMLSGVVALGVGARRRKASRAQ